MAAFRDTKRVTTTAERGVVLLYSMLFILFLASMLGFYQKASTSEMAMFRSSKHMKEAFYASEAALNLRADKLQEDLEQQIVPTGSPPLAANPCLGGNDGSGDMRCVSTEFSKTIAFSYVEPSGTSASWLQIPSGEAFAGLSAKEVEYDIHAFATDHNGNQATRTSMAVKMRLVPLFQFGVIFDRDLEFYPGPPMGFNGPVHTNRNLYLASETDLEFNGQMTAGENIYSGAKFDTGYGWNGNVWAPNGVGHEWIAGRGSTWMWAPEWLVSEFNGHVLSQAGRVNFPKITDFDPDPVSFFWSRADLRLVLQLDAANNPQAIRILRPDMSVNIPGTDVLNSTCASGTVAHSQGKFLDRREGDYMTLLEVDMRKLLDCLNSFPIVTMDGKPLDETSDGGLGFFLTVLGPNSSASSSLYGVRIANAEVLEATASGAPKPVGLSAISDQAVIIKGNYNSPPGNDDARIPSALLADTIHVLSAAWNDASSGTPLTGDACPATAAGCRDAVETTVNAALLAGFQSSGVLDGSDGHNIAPESGGLQNFLRFHERWTGQNFNYRGSIASIYGTRRSTGTFQCCGHTYNAPIRNWAYETRFLEVGRLPPMTPFFSYIKQELFDREYR